MRNIIFCFLLAVTFCSSRAKAQNSPDEIFEQIWNAYDTTYSGFAVKDIDWDKLHVIYKPMIKPDMSEKELFNVITDMLRYLNDNHVQIAKENPERHFSAGLLGYIIDDIGFDSTIMLYNTLPITENYFKYGLKTINQFSYGWLRDSIGYFHFKEFKNIVSTKQSMDSIISYFSNSKALMIDIRRNMGGDDKIGKLIADYFADKKREYMKTAEKNGKGHNDFSEYHTWYIEPNEFVQYLKPVILLVDNTSFSAAENFALAMREIPQVNLVGDFTAGGFADSKWEKLPCGWKICIPYSLFKDKNGFCWEGIGIPPDYRIKTYPTKPILETDKLVEFSIKLIDNKSGKN